MTSIKDQIAAARALSDAAIGTEGAHGVIECVTLVPQLATLLERACELLEDASASLYGDRYADVRAFLAGEVP